MSFVENFFYYFENYPIRTVLILLVTFLPFFNFRIYPPITPGMRRMLQLKKDLEQRLGFKAMPFPKKGKGALGLLVKSTEAAPPDFILKGLYKGVPVTITLFNSKTTTLKERFMASIKDSLTGFSVIVENDKNQFKLSQDKLNFTDIEILLEKVAS